MGKTLSTAIVIGLLVACGGGPASKAPEGSLWRANLHRTGAYSSEPVRQMSELKWKVNLGGMILTSPAISKGLIFVGGATDQSEAGFFCAVDAGTGEVAWKFETPGNVFSTPAISDGNVYFGCVDGNVYALDVKKGTQIWKSPTGGSIVGSSPGVAHGMVYISSTSDSLLALDARTGEKKWSLSCSSDDDSFSSPAVDGETVYYADYDGNLRAVDAQFGEERWALQLDGSVAGSIALSERIMILPANENLYAVGLTRRDEGELGYVMWEFEAEGNLGCPAIANEIVCVSSTVAKVWTPPYPGAAPTPWSKWESIPSYLLAIGTRTGQEIWRFELGHESDPDIRFIPSIAGDVIYCGSQEYLYALDLQTGELLWKFKTEGPLFAGPAIYEKVVYFGDLEGWLYAVR